MDELCSWLFPILFDLAERGGEREDKYQNRYPGFISERLISYLLRVEEISIMWCMPIRIS